MSVFLLPPSMSALAGRLNTRQRDSAAEIARRMTAAAAEMAHWAEFDHVVVNADFNATLDSVRAILCAARLSTRRQSGLPGFLADMLQS